MNEAEWLEDRRTAITASDCAAVLGEDPHKTALHVFADKIGAPSQEENASMRRGKLYESAIIADYVAQTGRTAVPAERRLVRHKKYPWIGATFDALTWVSETEHVPLQVKWAVGSSWSWAEEPPKHYQLQVLVESAVAGSRMGALCGLVGPGPLHCTDIPFDEELFELIVPRLAEFMERVRDRRPPEPQSSLALEPLKRLWPSGNGLTVQLDEHRQHDVEMWEANKSQAKRYTEAAEFMQAQIRHALGGAQFGNLPDGSLIERKVSKHRDVIQRIWPKRRA